MWAFTSHYVLFGNYNSLLAFMPIFFHSKGLCYFLLLERLLTSAVRAGLRVGVVLLKIFELFEHAYFACFFTVFGHVYSYWHTSKYSFVTTDFAILNRSKGCFQALCELAWGWTNGFCFGFDFVFAKAWILAPRIHAISRDRVFQFKFHQYLLITVNKKKYL